MKPRVAAIIALLFAATAVAATLPELLQRAKEQFRDGSYAAVLATLTELETESAKPGFEKDRVALQPIVAFYRGASYASLGKKDDARASFAIFLRHQPNASLDGSMYSKKVIAALEDARKSMPAVEEKPEPSLEAAYLSFPAPSTPQAEVPGEDWADGPVRYLLSGSERQEYRGLGGPSSRATFVSSFWERRDPRPETPENELRAEFEKRVSFADSRFTQGEMRGSLTDRGMVFLLLGPPTYIGRKPLATGEDAADASALSRGRTADARIAASGGSSAAGRREAGRTSGASAAAQADRLSGPGRAITDAAANWREVWHYRKEKLPAAVPYLQVDFEFVTKRGYGQNVLQRDAQALDTLERAKTVRQ